MHVRIEKIDDSQPEEVVVYCRSVRPEIEHLVQRIQQQDNASVLSFFKDDEQYYLSLQEILFFSKRMVTVFTLTPPMTPMKSSIGFISWNDCFRSHSYASRGRASLIQDMFSPSRRV